MTTAAPGPITGRRKHKHIWFGIWRYLQLVFLEAVGLAGASLILKGLLLFLDKLEPNQHLETTFGFVPAYAAIIIFCAFVVVTTVLHLWHMWRRFAEEMQDSDEEGTKDEENEAAGR